jgi:hypothetical protein
MIEVLEFQVNCYRQKICGAALERAYEAAVTNGMTAAASACRIPSLPYPSFAFPCLSYTSGNFWSYSYPILFGSGNLPSLIKRGDRLG